MASTCDIWSNYGLLVSEVTIWVHSEGASKWTIVRAEECAVGLDLSHRRQRLWSLQCRLCTTLQDAAVKLMPPNGCHHSSHNGPPPYQYALPHNLIIIFISIFNTKTMGNRVIDWIEMVFIWSFLVWFLATVMTALVSNNCSWFTMLSGSAFCESWWKCCLIFTVALGWERWSWPEFNLIRINNLRRKAYWLRSLDQLNGNQHSGPETGRYYWHTPLIWVVSCNAGALWHQLVDIFTLGIWTFSIPETANISNKKHIFMV